MTKLFQQLQQQPPTPQAATNPMTQAFLQSSNPSGFLKNMVKSNPKLQPIWDALTKSNLTPKQFFYQYAQDHNIDPDQFLQSFRKDQ